MKGYLFLENGEKFEGELTASSNQEQFEGEVVFYTGMTGYQEVLTDPSYKNQIVVFTYPLIGNYGINEQDFESKKPHVAGVIVLECKDATNHYEAKYSLKEYLDKWNVPLLSHVDTRSVVKQIRNHGTMQGYLAQTETKGCSTIEKFPVSEVSTKTQVSYGRGNKHVVLLDFGCKKSIIESLVERDCTVTVVPYHTTYEKIKELKPDGIVLSNGPGDPKQLNPYLPTIKKTIEKYPTLAICLGHQLVALSFGADTKKLTFGHRGANQPVFDTLKNKVFITSQNHSYVVDELSLKKTSLTARFKNVNDQSIEGVAHRTLPIVSVQFHPEAHPGPSDSSWVFDDFIESLLNVRREKQYA
ncbi:carbamoyl phosphate synthase small subunit [Litchfieldia salsa]|uniref:Carbamoyl phosphate synthase small chain n=1 Tax=Litchfieldia salsa TaxID=930152 RepID=A0A1H0S846_9BACI|nr:carbamoyl phosphate synthase small subunit [Litchfieldia salsa]SDP37689.1 carbamoyl-phosphate synthase small subunit [Litchfieldia salsa]